MFRHLLSLPLSYFESRRVGDSVARVRELERIREFLTSNAVTVVIDLFFTIVFFAVMYRLQPDADLDRARARSRSTSLISVFITPPLRARLDEKFRRGAENQAFLVETVTGIGTLKAMAVEPQMREQWEKQFAGYIQTGFAVTKLANWGNHLIQLVSKLTTVAILYFGAKAVIAGDLSVGSLVAFNMLAGRVAAPILRLSQLWQDFQQVRISVDRLGDVLNAPAEPEHNPNRASLPPIKGGIEFDKVRFRYRPDAPEALRGVTPQDRRRRDARHRRPVRLGQVDADQAGPAPLRAGAGPGAGRRRRSGAGRSGLAAAPDRRRAAGEHPVQPHRCARISRSPIRPGRWKR